MRGKVLSKFELPSLNQKDWIALEEKYEVLIYSINKKKLFAEEQ